ncbi:MAG TPA: HAMP domain-containing sensor histidine kinase [Candidatus Limnocylindrales bacterium]
MAPKTLPLPTSSETTPATAAAGAAQAAEAPTPASPLLHAALALVPPSATIADVEARFAAAGAVLRHGVAARLVAELAALGLVRVSRRGGDVRRYVPTSLGARAIETAIQREPAIGLAELERLRTDLLSTIAHELRTPLTSVRTSVGLLLDPRSEPTEDQRRALLEVIERGGERMQRLVEDILELSRFRSGHVTLQLRRFGATALAQAAADLVAPIAARSGQRIELAAPAGDHEVYGDRRRLEQALLNLLSNAHRFSPDGGSVRIRVERHRDQTAWVVIDDGPGITEADQSRLFERFFVARGDQSRPREGVGLGLPIALAIAQAHGGTIEVVSQVGVGSMFSLVVPSAGPPDEP